MLSAANTHDSELFEPLLETNPAVRGRRGRPGRPRLRPEKLHADKGYDYRRCRTYLHRRGIEVRIAQRAPARSGSSATPSTPRMTSALTVTALRNATTR